MAWQAYISKQLTVESGLEKPDWPLIFLTKLPSKLPVWLQQQAIVPTSLH